MTIEMQRYRHLPILVALIFAGLLLLVLTGPVFADADKTSGKRVALVVGNSNYESVYSLKNAVNDSRSVSVVLSRLGFEVIERSDATREQFMSALAEFKEAAQDAEAAVFYYSGHGFQMGGANFLVPTDARLNDRKKIRQETLLLSDVIQAVEDRERQTLIFLDACRNNPLPESVRDETTTDGLAQLEAGTGTFIAFATQPGNITRDGAGNNSPFAAALIEHMETPGISVSDMMIEVRNSVEVATLQTQTPWDQSSLRNQFYFLPQDEVGAALTDEDKELLLSLNPSLRKKFEARFGIRIEAGEESEDGEREVRVTKVKPTLLIQQGQQVSAEIVVDEDKPVKGRFQISQGGTEQAGSEEVQLASLETDENSETTSRSELAEPEAESVDQKRASSIPVPRPVYARKSNEKPSLVASLARNEAAPKTATRSKIDVAPRADEVAQTTAAVRTGQQPTGKVSVAKTAPVKPNNSEADIVTTANQATVIVGEPGQLSGQSQPEGTVIATQQNTGGAVPKADPVANVAKSTTSSQRVTSVTSRNSGTALSPPDNSGKSPSVVTPDMEVALAVNSAKSATRQIESIGVVAVDSAPKRLIGKEVTPTGAAKKPANEFDVASLGAGEEKPAAGSNRVQGGITPAKEQSITPPSHAIEVQAELSRLGCYRSKVDGIWGAYSARALLRYYGNKKIAPDVLEPTGVLLASLQSEEVVVCKRTIIKPKKKKKKKKVATRKSGSGKKATSSSRGKKKTVRAVKKKTTKKRTKRAARKKALKKGLSSGVFR